MTDRKALNAELADQLQAWLHANLPEWKPRRVYVPHLELGDLQKLQVLVSVKSDAREVQDRQANRETHNVDVGFYQLVDKEQPQQVDRLLAEVEQLKLLFSDPDEVAADPWAAGFEHVGELRDEQLAGCDWAVLTNDPLYDPELLEEAGQFTSVVSLEYTRCR